jgi:DNA (cytosine-5)-methyltransferase 1
MARVVSEVRPRYVFVENSPMLVTRGLERVLGDLTALGYDTKWTVMGAADVGANHQRDRIWIVATNVVDSKSSGDRRNSRELQEKNEQQAKERQEERIWQSDNASQSNVAFSESAGLERWQNGRDSQQAKPGFGESSWAVKEYWRTEPNVGRVVDGMAARVDRLKAIGNGQVPLCAAEAWRLLTK